MDSKKTTSENSRLVSANAAGGSPPGKPTGSSKGAKKHHGKIKTEHGDTKKHYALKDRLDVDLLGIGSWCDGKD